MRTSLALLLACSPLLMADPDPAKIRVLLFSGVNNHDWRTTTPHLKKVLLDSGRFDVRVEEWPTGTTAKSFEQFDAIVLDYCGARWGEATEKALENFVKSGKGLVAIHAASYPFGKEPILGDRAPNTGKTEPPWMEYRKMVGAYWERPQGIPNPSGHGDRYSFQVKFKDRNHPIAEGLGESFWATDEFYHSLRMMPGVKVLATAYDDPKFRGTGKEEPVLWTVDYGKGKVFHTILGHNLAAMQEPGFISTFLRGTEWAATGKVQASVAVAPKPGPRLLVVTGGHDYETSFYSLFDGMNWDHATTNEIAFKNDIRKKYDVVLTYDMHQTISDRAKKNLTDFVEGGKGLVILHHAICGYNNWEWWWKEVMAGRYILKAEPGLPASTWKHDQEMFVRPAMKHPVVGDVGPLHIIDETYSGVWVSKDAKVLMTTDHPLVNGPVAWISPYEKSRVVTIVLGHDHQAHANAGFRQLIKNAVSWTASGR